MFLCQKVKYVIFGAFSSQKSGEIFGKFARLQYLVQVASQYHRKKLCFISGLKPGLPIDDCQFFAIFLWMMATLAVAKKILKKH
jgi:hypothetical protein